MQQLKRQNDLPAVAAAAAAVFRKICWDFRKPPVFPVKAVDDS